ncbi:MAG: hypothetical protein AB7J40_05660 [Candidatus Altimarinota bacterium]
MDYQTLTEKIEGILHCTPLKKPERAILLQSYLNPGVAERSLEKGVQNFQALVERMIEKGLILRKKEAGEELLYPLPIALLFKKYVDERKARSLDAVESLHSIDQWIQYPLLRSPEVQMKSSHDNETVLNWLFELHATDWERVFCFGDYESFINAIGIDTEQDWIRERTKKNRCASVVATQDGQWAQHIRKASEKELRDCLIDPRDFTDMFIMAFPDIQTTVIGTSKSEVTFIHSKTVANTYTELVERCLVK